MTRRLITAMGDVNDPECWSGIPYHLLQSGLDSGIFHGGVRLDCDGFARRRALWNVSEWVSGRGVGGFQYCDPFLEKIWRSINTLKSGDTLINLFQLFPSSIATRRDLRRIFYIDQTLAQLFEHYPTHVSSYHRRAAIDREREQYLSADLLIAHCRWAADSLIDQYRVPNNRVAVVLPGSNISPRYYAEWETERSMQLATGALSHKPSTPMRFVFVGKDGHRKGLDRLLAAMNSIPCVQQRMQLTVIGCARGALPTNLRHTNGVVWFDPI